MNEAERAAQKALESVLGGACCCHFEAGQTQSNGLRRVCEVCALSVVQKYESVALVFRQQDVADVLSAARLQMREFAADLEALRPFQDGAVFSAVFSDAWAHALSALVKATEVYSLLIVPASSTISTEKPCSDLLANGQPSPYSVR